jgi:hypothetical protein
LPDAEQKEPRLKAMVLMTALLIENSWKRAGKKELGPQLPGTLKRN